MREKARDLLGDDDALFEMIAKQVTIAEKNIAEVRSIIARGTPMEEW